MHVKVYWIDSVRNNKNSIDKLSPNINVMSLILEGAITLNSRSDNSYQKTSSIMFYTSKIQQIPLSNRYSSQILVEFSSQKEY